MGDGRDPLHKDVVVLYLEKWGKGEKNSKCKSPVFRSFLVCLRDSREASVAEGRTA